MIIYKYSRYSREQEERIDATPDAVLHRAFSDIEGNTAYPLAICAEDGSIIFDEYAIHQKWEESEETALEDGSGEMDFAGLHEKLKTIDKTRVTVNIDDGMVMVFIDGEMVFCEEERNFIRGYFLLHKIDMDKQWQ